VLVGATGVLVAAIAALALQSWWVLIALLLLHAVVTTSVVVYTLGRAGDTYDKPDPVTEARIEEGRGPERDERRRPGDRDREVFS
jgi:membrane protein implicated in regulation of membrane protease activity